MGHPPALLECSGSHHCHGPAQSIITRSLSDLPLLNPNPVQNSDPVLTPVLQVLSSITWGLLEYFGVIPTLILNIGAGAMEGEDTSGMPMIVGYATALLFLFKWQPMRRVLGLSRRMCFLNVP